MAWGASSTQQSLPCCSEVLCRDVQSNLPRTFVQNPAEITLFSLSHTKRVFCGKISQNNNKKFCEIIKKGQNNIFHGCSCNNLYLPLSLVQSSKGEGKPPIWVTIWWSFWQLLDLAAGPNIKHGCLLDETDLASVAIACCTVYQCAYLYSLMACLTHHIVYFLSWQSMPVWAIHVVIEL